MQLPLSSHLSFLEARIATLKAQLAETGRTAGERDGMQSSLHLAEMALVYYRKAYELEQAVRVPQSVDSD